MKTLLLFSFVFVFTACSPSVKTVYLGGLNAGPSKSVESVTVYLTGDDVQRPYENVAILTCPESNPGDTEAVQSLRYRAAEIGCDAIIIGGSGLETYVSHHNKSAIAIRYTQ